MHKNVYVYVYWSSSARVSGSPAPENEPKISPCARPLDHRGHSLLRRDQHLPHLLPAAMAIRVGRLTQCLSYSAPGLQNKIGMSLTAADDRIRDWMVITRDSCCCEGRSVQNGQGALHYKIRMRPPTSRASSTILSERWLQRRDY